MRTTRDFRRSGAALAVAALPLTLATATTVAAASGISVSTSGSKVTVTTSACRSVDGGFGSASLLSSGQSNFSQGRQMSLSGTSAGQSAVWSNVGSRHVHRHRALPGRPDGGHPGRGRPLAIGAVGVRRTLGDFAVRAVRGVPCVFCAPCVVGTHRPAFGRADARGTGWSRRGGHGPQHGDHGGRMGSW